MLFIFFERDTNDGIIRLIGHKVACRTKEVQGVRLPPNERLCCGNPIYVLCVCVQRYRRACSVGNAKSVKTNGAEKTRLSAEFIYNYATIMSESDKEPKGGVGSGVTFLGNTWVCERFESAIN